MVIDSRFKVNPNDLENVIFPFPGVVVRAAVGIAKKSQEQAIKVLLLKMTPL